MKWTITYYDETLEKEIFGLPDGVLAKFIKLTEIMREFGPNIGMPHSRAMGNGLFELRLKEKEGIARVFYCTFTNQRIHFLHNFIKKTQKTPTKELHLARERMKEVKKNGK
jgi:phage-related protein